MTQLLSSRVAVFTLCHVAMASAVLGQAGGEVAADGAAIERDRAVAAFASGDSVAIEIACRRLAVGAAADVPVEAIVAQWRTLDDHGRRAVADLFVRHGVGQDALRRLATTSGSAAVVRAALPALESETLRAWITEGPRRFAGDALRELFRRGKVDPELIAAAVACDDEDLVEVAVGIAVGLMHPFPVAAFVGLPEGGLGLRQLVEALSSRPRPEAVPLLDRARDRLPVDDPERIAIFGAYPRGHLDAEQAQEILRAAASRSAPFGDLIAASERLSPELCDRMVGPIFRLASQGQTIEFVLQLLGPLSATGEKRLAALGRAGLPAQRDAVLAWLDSRDAPCVADVLRDLLKEDDVTPELVRRAASLLDEEAPRRRVVELLEGAAGDDAPDLRLAAFTALAKARRFTPAMLDFALEAEDERDLPRRVQSLLAAPVADIPDAAWRRLLEHADARVRARTMSRILDDAEVLVPRLEPELLVLARQRVRANSDPALRALIIAAKGPDAAFVEVWRRLDAARRSDVVTAFADGAGDWRLPFLRRDPAAETVEFEYARLALGDAEVRRAVLADPSRWPIAWLRRAKSSLARGLDGEDLDVLRRLLVRSDSVSVGLQFEIVDWLAARSDLPGVGKVLAAIWDGSDDPMLREQVDGLLLAMPEGQPRRAELEARLGQAFDEEVEADCFVLALAATPVRALRDAQTLARIGFLAPLGDPQTSVMMGRVEGDEGAAVRLPLVSALARAWRDGVRAEQRKVFEDAAAEARRHPAHWASSRIWLGQLLTEACRLPEARHHIAPVVAELLCTAPDSDASFVGAARLILAEDAERRGDFGAAADHYAAAGRAFAAPLLGPAVARCFVGASDPALGVVPMAWLASRPPLCRARAAQASGVDVTAVRALLFDALHLAHGDADAEEEIRSLLEELR